jgi:hypothetical protein
VSIALTVVGVWLAASVVVGAVWALIGLGLRRGRCPSDQVEGPASARVHRDSGSSTGIASEIASPSEVASDAQARVSDPPRA